MRLSLWASHSLTAGRSVVFLLSSISSLASPPPSSVCYLSPPYFRRALKVCQQLPSGKTTKIKNHCSPSLFHSSFFPPLEQTPSLCSIPFFPPGIQNSCSPPPLIVPQPNSRSFLSLLIHPKPTSFKFPAFLPESLCNFHLVFPMFPAPSLSLP